jgi:hypothetical protein
VVRALGALVESSAPDGVEALLAALDDPDEGVKQAGIEALAL